MLKSSTLDWLQTLADGTRVRLLRLLEQDELTVSEACAVVQMPQSTVSRHLRVLAADGWLTIRRDKNHHYYRADRQDWEDSQVDLWLWVQKQVDTPTTLLDDQRLQQVVANRSQGEAFFHSAAEQWDSLRTDLFGKQLDAFVLAASLPDNAVVAELGCGSAAITQMVAPHVKKVYAIDSSAAMLKAARKRLKGLQHVSICNDPLESLSLSSSSLDLAWLVAVLPYLNEPWMVFKEVARVLKPLASLVIVDLVPHDRSHYEHEMGHLRLGTSRRELTNWLDRAGLAIRVYRQLPPDPVAKGPGLFAATVRAKETT
ncbi:MAG: metalloregulator ArsR/SmtB family transcription factor [Planctomycetales bacterium]|nr:metalloregulator ArsR/SmtB family transcription factor [Planctomycetales bacterium]